MGLASRMLEVVCQRMFSADLSTSTREAFAIRTQQGSALGSERRKGLCLATALAANYYVNASQRISGWPILEQTFTRLASPTSRGALNLGNGFVKQS